MFSMRVVPRQLLTLYLQDKLHKMSLCPSQEVGFDLLPQHVVLLSLFPLLNRPFYSSEYWPI